MYPNYPANPIIIIPKKPPIISKSVLQPKNEYPSWPIVLSGIGVRVLLSCFLSIMIFFSRSEIYIMNWREKRLFYN